MTKVYEIFLIFFFLTSIIFSQIQKSDKYGITYRNEFNNTAFPHSSRNEGHVYKGQHYNLEDHYNDKSVIIFIPKYFAPSDSIDMVFYFHGWRNNIDSTLVKFNLIEQFYKSNKNGILVLPEGAKNSPDSFGGNLEENNIFKDLAEEVLEKLTDIYQMKLDIGSISLAGHSGAYRVIAHILMNGGITDRIDAVYLFDGFYADTEKFTYWIDNFYGKFINIYTQKGGTKSKSENLIKYLNGRGIPHLLIENDNFASDNLRNNRIIIIKSELGHNEVIHTNNQFQKFLESSL